MFKIRQRLFSPDGDIGTASDSPSVEGVDETTDTGTASVSEETTEDVTKQQSFAHRLKESTEKALAEERTKWEKETSEKYKDYDTHKELSQYLQEINGADLLTLKEQIEMEKLQTRAEKENMSPEVLKRLDELEAKAARGDELEQQQLKQQNDNLFWSSVDKFVADKEVSKEDLNKFMLDNEIFVDLSNEDKMTRKFELAYKAMQHDNVVQKLGSAEKDGMKKLIQAKGNIATIPGKSAQGQVVSAPPKTWADARARAMQRE